MRHWLMKSEPSTYSIDDLARDGKTAWEGVRNYQARNMMRDDMSLGDLVLFYHSSADPPGVAGIARVCRTAYPDASAWNKNDPHFDEKTDPKNPIWMMVDLEFVEKLPHFVTLDELQDRGDLEGLMVIKRGMRLSIQPVDPKHFATILQLGRGTSASNAGGATTPRGAGQTKKGSGGKGKRPAAKAGGGKKSPRASPRAKPAGAPATRKAGGVKAQGKKARGKKKA